MADGRFEGQVAIVTGASSGIGRAAAEIIAKDGGSVVAVDINEDALAWTESNNKITAYAGDISTKDSNAGMVEAATTAFGKLDIAVFNAGIAGTGPIDASMLETYDRIMAVNLRGVVLGIAAVAPAMKKAGGGAIVTTASVSGLGGDPGMWAYNASKGGVINLCRGAALDLALDNIRVNVVCPGPIRTGITKPLEEGAPDTFEGLRRHIPLQRWGEASEVGEVICFLASHAASFVTGAVVPADGGVTANTGQFLPPQKEI